MKSNDLKHLVEKNSDNFHKGSDGSWGTDDHDGTIVADILRGIGDMISTIIRANRH